MNLPLTLRRTVGRATCPPSLWRERRQAVRLPYKPYLCLLLLTACSTTAPRVLEVTSRTRLQDIDAADTRLFVEDEASRIKYEPQDLSIDNQREEFYVRWAPASIGLVKFEYRQIAKPGTIFEQTYTPHGDASKVFAVRGEAFRSGGSVSAWRVSLWNGDQLLAEKKSFLW
jgi:hypothetical protein